MSLSSLDSGYLSNSIGISYSGQDSGYTNLSIGKNLSADDKWFNYSDNQSPTLGALDFDQVGIPPNAISGETEIAQPLVRGEQVFDNYVVGEF